MNKGYRFDLNMWEEKKYFWMVPYYKYNVFVSSKYSSGTWIIISLFKKRGEKTVYKPIVDRREERGYGPIQSIE